MTALETAPEAYDDEDASSLGSDDSGFRDSEGDTSTHFTGDTGKSDSSSEDIAKEGRATVLGSKLLVLFILGIAAAAVGWATFKNTSSQEEENFERQVSKRVKRPVDGCE